LIRLLKELERVNYPSLSTEEITRPQLRIQSASMAAARWACKRVSEIKGISLGQPNLVRINLNGNFGPFLGIKGITGFDLHIKSAQLLHIWWACRMWIFKVKGGSNLHIRVEKYINEFNICKVSRM
jgi:hypothetical protein